jgi:hypothetical protein
MDSTGTKPANTKPEENAAITTGCVESSIAAEEDQEEVDVDELLEEDVSELMPDDLRTAGGDSVMSLDIDMDVADDSGTMIEVRKEEHEEGEQEHDVSCDCVDCDQVDYLHGYVDGEPYGIK